MRWRQWASNLKSMTPIDHPPKSKRGGKRAGAGRKARETPLEVDLAQPIEQTLSLIETLKRTAKVGRSDYSRIDRYRDFSRVLLGTPEGKRVLGQIVSLLEGPPTKEHELSNHALMAARQWCREMAGTIVGYAVDVPTNGPTAISKSNQP